KNQNPQNGHHWARFDWGLGAVCSGASPVAAVFGSAPASATPPEHRSYFNPAPLNSSSKPDISTWQRTGHFYLALTAMAVQPMAVELVAVRGVGSTSRTRNSGISMVRCH